VRVLRWFTGAQEGSGITGGEESGRRADLPAAASGTIPAAAAAVVEDGRRGVTPGARAELLRWLAVAGVWRSGEATAEQGLCSGAEVARVVLGCRGGGSVVRVGHRGSTGAN
jgi:hypothetical protein